MFVQGLKTSFEINMKRENDLLKRMLYKMRVEILRKIFFFFSNWNYFFFNLILLLSSQLNSSEWHPFSIWKRFDKELIWKIFDWGFAFKDSRKASLVELCVVLLSFKWTMWFLIVWNLNRKSQKKKKNVFQKISCS